MWTSKDINMPGDFLRVKNFKTEVDHYEQYNPLRPAYKTPTEESDSDDDIAEKPNPKFRCPFREEKDGKACNIKDDKKNEILNHFYMFHFDRVNQSQVFEEPLNCFFT